MLKLILKQFQLFYFKILIQTGENVTRVCQVLKKFIHFSNGATSVHLTTTSKSEVSATLPNDASNTT